MNKQENKIKKMIKKISKFYKKYKNKKYIFCEEKKNDKDKLIKSGCDNYDPFPLGPKIINEEVIDIIENELINVIEIINEYEEDNNEETTSVTSEDVEEYYREGEEGEEEIFKEEKNEDIIEYDFLNNTKKDVTSGNLLEFLNLFDE